MPAEWPWNPIPQGELMALGDRIRQLRTENRWSQGDLAERIGGDAGQISRYEHGKITPSADLVVKLAQALNVSCDYLLVDDAPRRPFRTPQDALGDRLATVAELADDDLELVTRFIDALVTKTRLRNLQADAS